MISAIALLMASLAAPPVELIAHRGESADAPENTLAAFNLAWERKVPAIELDVHLTADGVAAVIHDFDTRRTCGVKKLIRETNWSDLQALDAGSWKNPKFAGEKIPRLEQALATVPAGGKCFIEIKVGAEAVPVVAKAVESSGLKPEQLVIISFQAEAVAAARQQLPQLKAYYLSGFKPDWQSQRWTPTIEQLIATAKKINADGLDLSYRGPIDAELVQKVREAKLGLLVWTVNDADIARDLVKLGVDGITTDKAAWLRSELDKPGE
jgi:glycerophosphoryl diester phosphodiesterase